MKKKSKILLAVLIAGLAASGAWGAAKLVRLRPATGEGTQAERKEEAGAVPAIYLSAAEAGEEITSLPPYELYIEGEGPTPAWYMPDEPMAAEWEASCQQVAEANNEAVFGDSVITSDEDLQVTEAEAHPPVGIDAGGIDWNLCTSLTGWDGHRAEIWELDLYARIMYLEFWGTSPECCEAGADSILRLWESGYYGPTLGDTLTARAEDGSLVYSPYAYVWDWEYDPAGLAEMRALCEERFYNGPEWDAPFFRLWYYHPWAVDMYEIDGVYFSTVEGWQ